MEAWGKQLNQVRKYTLISLDRYRVYRRSSHGHKCCARVAVDEATTATKDLNNAFAGLCANKVQANIKVQGSTSTCTYYITTTASATAIATILPSDDT